MVSAAIHSDRHAMVSTSESVSRAYESRFQPAEHGRAAGRPGRERVDDDDQQRHREEQRPGRRSSAARPGTRGATRPVSASRSSPGPVRRCGGRSRSGWTSGGGTVVDIGAPLSPRAPWRWTAPTATRTRSPAAKCSMPGALPCRTRMRRGRVARPGDHLVEGGVAEEGHPLDPPVRRRRAPGRVRWSARRRPTCSGRIATVTALAGRPRRGRPGSGRRPRAAPSPGPSTTPRGGGSCRR